MTARDGFRRTITGWGFKDIIRFGAIVIYEIIIFYSIDIFNVCKINEITCTAYAIDSHIHFMYEPTEESKNINIKIFWKYSEVRVKTFYIHALQEFFFFIYIYNIYLIRLILNDLDYHWFQKIHMILIFFHPGPQKKNFVLELFSIKIYMYIMFR